MADQASNIHAKRCFDWMTSATIKAVLVMTDTQADSETAKDSDTCAGFTVDDFDGSNGDPATLTLQTSADDSNNRGKVTHSTGSTTFSGITGGSRAIQGVIVVEWLGSLSASRFLGYFEFSSPYTAAGRNLRINWSTEGLFYIAT